MLRIPLHTIIRVVAANSRSKCGERPGWNPPEDHNAV